MLLSNVLLAQEVTKNIEFKTGRAAGNTTEKKVNKKARKIFINSFRVDYQLVYVDQEQTREGVYHGATSASLTVGFNGVEIEDFQKMTDDLYVKYTDMLKAEGYTFMTADDASSYKVFKDWERVKGPIASQAEKVGYLSTIPSN